MCITSDSHENQAKLVNFTKRNKSSPNDEKTNVQSAPSAKHNTNPPGRICPITTAQAAVLRWELKCNSTETLKLSLYLNP